MSRQTHGSHALLLLVLLLLLLALTACSPAETPRTDETPRTSRPDVVLITLDTLRADHLGAYGASGVMTPVIDALAREGLLFENAVAPLPETRPSHYSIFTSLYPRQHGVVSNMAQPVPGLVALPRLFQDAGYRTAGFVGAALFSPEEAKKTLGFDHFDAPQRGQRTAAEVLPPTLAWLGERDPDQPFFLWLHLFDAHMPYQPPPPFNERGASAAELERLPRFGWEKVFALAKGHDGDLPSWAFERALELYAGEVEYTDAQVGRLLAALRERGRLDETVLLVTADHGECFAGGVFFDHSQCLDEGALAVPLVLRYPPAVPAGERRSTVVELLDVAPTLLGLAGLPVPAAFAGRDLLADEDGPGEAFFEHPYYRAEDVRRRLEAGAALRSVAGQPVIPIRGDELRLGLRRGAFKYLRYGTNEELYDLDADPAEQHDLAPEQAERRMKMRRAVVEWEKAHPLSLQDPDALDPELRRQLEALGYI